MGTTTWIITVNSTVRPGVGRRRSHIFEAEWRRTERTAGDGEEPSPVVIHRYPWILVYITKLILHSVQLR